MIILGSKNVKTYVVARSRDLPFAFRQVVKVEEITEETYVNWIFRVSFKTTTGSLVVYLRQSRNFVKKKPEYKLPRPNERAEGDYNVFLDSGWSSQDTFP